jgi:archaemetzincin
MADIIYVAPIDNPLLDALGAVQRRIRDEFGVPVGFLRPPVDVAAAYDKGRGQYNSTTLLAALLRVAPTEARIIGVTGVDLFIPVLTFVFGEAQLDGQAAVASSYRLRNSFYGLPADHTLTLNRLEKECVHELGHTFGLKHCADFRCVMRASTSVEEIDIKGDSLCRICQSHVNAHLSR